MGEKVDRLVALAKVWVPPHVSARKGKPFNVDGYWREAGGSSQLLGRERKAIAAKRDLTNAQPGDSFLFESDREVLRGEVIAADGDAYRVRVGSGIGTYEVRLPKGHRVMQFRPGFGKVSEEAKFLTDPEAEPSDPIEVYDVQEAMDDPRHGGHGLWNLDQGGKRGEVALRAVAREFRRGGFSREDLFQWTNSKFARHFADAVNSGDAPTIAARGIPEEVAVLRREGYR